MEEATGGGGNQTTYGKENTPPIRGRRVRAQQSLAVNPSSPIRAVQRSYVEVAEALALEVPPLPIAAI